MGQTERSTRGTDVTAVPQRAAATPADEFIDLRRQAAEQRDLADLANRSPRLAGQREVQTRVAQSARSTGASVPPVAQRVAGADRGDASPEPAFVSSVESDGTQLPRRLRVGIERLAGLGMHGVRVYRNSARPAQLQARAFAQGDDIHLAPGEEQLLPHETWHLVQQRQGRVGVTMRAAGHAINDDAGLEREADAMGALALSSGVGDSANEASTSAARPDPDDGRAFPGGTHSAAANPHGAVAQRTPDAAIASLPAHAPEKQQLEQILANTRRLSSTYYAVTAGSPAFHTLRGEIRLAVAKVDRIHASFANTWNTGLKRTAVEYIPSEEPDYQQRAAKPEPTADGLPGYLTQWQRKMHSDKSMTADKKFASVLPMILSEPELPPALHVALKLLFTHTSNFVPVEMQGRDIRSVEHGQYSRTSMTPVRSGNSTHLRNDGAMAYAENDEQIPAGRTFQVTNQPLHAALVRAAKLSSNIEAMTHYGDTDRARLAYSEYTSSAGSHTGSLGLIPNMHRTLEVGGYLESDPERKAFGGKGHDEWKPTPLPANDWRPVVSAERLQPNTDQNYHDFLLADRAELVFETAAAIRQLYADADIHLSVLPIQSSSHASLILDLRYPDDYPEDRKLSEAQWRELLLAKFNAAAAEAKLLTRITHRASFGFPYPTASSVGGPVRIWPGLAPKDVFKRIVVDTLLSLNDVKKVAATAKAKAKTLKRPFAATRMPEAATSSASGTGGARGEAILHIEALKTAVRYAQDTMSTAHSALGPARLVEWVRVRLRKNLLKADYCLKGHAPGMPADHDYVQIAGIIENLMEYSYLLEAMLHEPVQQEDVYPRYLQETLQLNQRAMHQATFYLDSGMQALVCAHLVARAWLEKLASQDKAKVFNGDSLQTVDLNSYFEYASIDKKNLRMNAMNRGSDGSYVPEHALLKQLETRTPGIVSADLNPVLNKASSGETQASPGAVFGQLAGKQGAKNSTTIPIVDITNASLGAVDKLNLGAGYANFFVAESLSKHQQLGADKFTMGRLSAVGTEAFVALAKEIIAPIAEFAAHPLPAAYRQRMDRMFYGDPRGAPDGIASHAAHPGAVPGSHPNADVFNGLDLLVAAVAEESMMMEEEYPDPARQPEHPAFSGAPQMSAPFAWSAPSVPFSFYPTTPDASGATYAMPRSASYSTMQSNLFNFPSTAMQPQPHPFVYPGASMAQPVLFNTPFMSFHPGAMPYGSYRFAMGGAPFTQAQPWLSSSQPPTTSPFASGFGSTEPTGDNALQSHARPSAFRPYRRPEGGPHKRQRRNSGDIL
ncbi:DUF4157 domain-containing protein [Massilia antarctica]|uniref:DUF4157 domain-containing protein n=1 Tax=Massilia antarctica TaxID=2765360 RepID=A0AA49A9H0_9BURK|nr:DUF4157 domain-containing protein [Massilia antarctica]QPI51409.1 DUF4157 domain-containing protein [Massilia antarctica]